MFVDCLICIRREDRQQHELFSYSSLEERIPADHPLRPIRTMVDEAPQALDGCFDEIYGEDGRGRFLRSGCCARYCYCY